MKVLSLFDGISCGMVALERAGIPVEEYVAYEIDENAIKVSEFNYPQIKHCGDVFNAEYNGGGYDLLIGGSPCTYWSIARHTNTEHKREITFEGLGADLFMQYYRALQEAKPKYFLYENNNSISKEIKDKISELLGVDYIMINSNKVSGQNRERCYWTNIPNVQQPEDKHIYFKDIIDKNNRPDMRPIGKWMLEGTYFGKPKLDVAKDFNSLKSNTLTTKKGHPVNYYLNDEHTMYSNLTADEWEILQTLPQGYTSCVKDAERYKCIGNGWTVDVIAHIFKGLK